MSMSLWRMGMVVGVGILLHASVWGAGVADFSRYEVILLRKPFGEPPPAEVPPAPPPVTAEQSFVKNIRLCAITESEDFGLRVGFVDLAAKKNYYLNLGETEDGIEVVDADYEKEAALLRKGAEEFWVYMNGMTSPGGGAEPISTAMAVSAVGPSLPTAKAGVSKTSYLERLRLRRQALEDRRKKQAEAEPVLKGEELQAHLESYQMDLIRSGGQKGPPLPMPLTKEMDDQLVTEGVLPPADGQGDEVVLVDENGQQWTVVSE